MKEWVDDKWWEWWVDETDGGSAAPTTRWVRIGEIGAYMVNGEKPEIDSRDEGKHTLKNDMLCVEKVM